MIRKESATAVKGVEVASEKGYYLLQSRSGKRWIVHLALNDALGEGTIGQG
jgi:hypothetical protein